MKCNETEIRKAISVLKPDQQLFECRVLYDNKKVNSGYFKDADTLIAQLKKINLESCNIYITLQRLNDACYARSQKDHFELYTKATTSDGDVTGYEWLFIDLDPRRPSGTSSSEEELGKAKELGNKIYNFMSQLGFNKPIMAFSGNGVHLLYKIHLKNCEDNKQKVKRCLETLDMLFSTDDVEVDTTNFNPARVCKLYGVVSAKGSNTEDRPHRLARIIGNPDQEQIKVNDIAYIDKLCALYPKEPEKSEEYNKYNPKDFDVEEWLTKYGIGFSKKQTANYTKFVLDECPFDCNHKAPDSMVTIAKNGAIGFKCLHNSCSNHDWHALRMKYEPTAYEKKQNETEKKMYHNYNRDRQYNTVKEQKHIVKDGDKPIFYSALDILYMPQENESFVKTGTNEIDRTMRGLKKGSVSLVSGLRGSAKSTWLSEVALNAVDDGNRVGVFSGELSCQNFFRWLNLQAAGKKYSEPTNNPNFYTTSAKTREMIAKWLVDKLFLYNNDYGNDFVAIMEVFEKLIVEKKIDLLILDNLMAFNTRSLSDDKYQAQTDFVLSLTKLAKKYQVAIVFVAHPRKAQGFLRLDDISGSADLSNAVDNAFIVHRCNNDFRRLTAQMFGWTEDNPVYRGTNAIEICKDRDTGTQDVFIPLWYELETKRLCNFQAENKIYGWAKDNKQLDFSDIDINTEDLPFE